MKRNKKFNIGFRVLPTQRQKGVWVNTITTRLPLLTHEDIAEYAKENNLTFEHAHNRLIGIAFTALEEGLKVESNE